MGGDKVVLLIAVDSDHPLELSVRFTQRVVVVDKFTFIHIEILSLSHTQGRMLHLLKALPLRHNS